MNFANRTWAEINLDNALFNLEQIKKTSRGRKIMCVLKAEAYGHGADTLALLYQNNGVDLFAVSNVNEAVKLRNAGVTAEILILGYTPINAAKKLIDYNLVQTLYSFEYAKMLSSELERLNAQIKAHIKLDTGMSRIGFNCKSSHAILASCDEIIKISKMDQYNVRGLMTHFSCADSENSDDVFFTQEQYSNFMSTYNKLKEQIDFEYYHCCNSAASSLLDAEVGNVIRAGIMLYGIRPSFDFNLGFEPKPLLSLKTVVAAINEVDRGEYISYGRTFKAKCEMKIATLPVGYADGYPRALSNNGKVIINGKFANIVGKICMDQMMIDISNIENVDIGDEVILIGESNGISVTADDISKLTGTISYEVICDISARVLRIYIKDNKIITTDYLLGEKVDFS